MRALRLLVFSPYFPPHVGGLEGYVSDLHEALLDGGEVEAITLLTPRLPPEGARREQRRADYAVLRYPAFELIPNFPVPTPWSAELWRTFKGIDLRAHDVFVSHTRFFLTSALALALARRARRPLLHVEHGSDFVQLGRPDTRAAARAYDHTLGRAVLRRADAVVAISRAAAAFVEELAHRDATVVYRGMDTAGLDAALPDEQVLERAGGRPVIVFAGRLIDGKGVADLLEAFAAVGAGRALLCVVGDGPRRADLEAQAQRLGIAAEVMFPGHMPELRAWRVVRAADIVVNPSYTEGLPTSVLEAALMGKAIVASSVGGTGEIVTDGVGGLLFEPRDVSALGSRLRELLADPALRATLGSQAGGEARGRFDWGVAARRFGQIARELAGARGGPQAADRTGLASTSSKTDS